jgi:predicted transcriptional regulator
MVAEPETLVALTADIVRAHVSNNHIAASDIGGLIEKVHAAFAGLATPPAPVDEPLKGAVSIRASVKPDHLISMLDGKPYKMLKRHLTINGYTPERYRETFGLPKDYPMVAPSYAARRSDLAKKIGLGKGGRPAPVPPVAKAARKPKATEPGDA